MEKRPQANGPSRQGSNVTQKDNQPVESDKKINSGKYSKTLINHLQLNYRQNGFSYNMSATESLPLTNLFFPTLIAMYFTTILPHLITVF